MTKEAAGGRLPRPPDVEADFAQGLERGGKSGDYIIGLEVRHGGNGLTVAILSRKGKKVSSVRWSRGTCRERSEASLYRLSVNVYLESRSGSLELGLAPGSQLVAPSSVLSLAGTNKPRRNPVKR